MEHITLLLGIVIVTAPRVRFHATVFHDTANAMATTISTGALKPKTAVAMSAVLNLVGAFLSVEVAKTISGGIINEEGIRVQVIFAALVGAILWNLLTWLLGLPSSSSHSLFGGLIRAAVMSAGWSSVNGSTVVTKVLIPAVAAPIVAGLAAMLATRLTYRIGNRADEKATAEGLPRRPDRLRRPGLPGARHERRPEDDGHHHPRPGQLRRRHRPGLEPPAVGHRLGRYGHRARHLPGRLAHHPHLGQRASTDLAPPQGFAAQTSAATAILASSHIGFSLSTTQRLLRRRDGLGPRLKAAWSAGRPRRGCSSPGA